MEGLRLYAVEFGFLFSNLTYKKPHTFSKIRGVGVGGRRQKNRQTGVGVGPCVPHSRDHTKCGHTAAHAANTIHVWNKAQNKTIQLSDSRQKNHINHHPS